MTTAPRVSLSRMSGSPGARRAAAVALTLVLVLGAGTAADARLGGGGSFGSRGGRTFSMPGATPTAPRIAPIERSTTAAPFSRPYGNGFAGARPGFFGGGFGRGLLGGFLGAGLFGLLFGGGFGGGLGGGMSLIGLLLQFALLFFVVRWVIGFFRNRNDPAFNSGSMPYASNGGGFSGGAGSYGGAPTGGQPVSQGTPIQIGPQDYETFERILVESQNAYSEGDLGRLRQIATPEMVGNFQRELESNRREGVVNKITGVHLINGDLSEAWREANGDYATVAMRFGLVDATLDLSSGRVVAGDAQAPQQVTEVWTFIRPVGTEPQAWALSAIQQS